MKRFIRSTFVILLIICGLAFSSGIHSSSAQIGTPVSGIINTNTTWARENSPFNLIGPIAIVQGITLTIEPGTIINFNGYYLQVNGTLIARGTTTNLIYLNRGNVTFTQSSSSWNEQIDSGCSIENTNTTDVYSTSIYINNAAPKISKSSNMYVNINGGAPIISGNTNLGIFANTGSPTIIGNDKIWGITEVGVGSPIILNNNITSSSYVDNNYAAIALGYSDGAIIAYNNITSIVTNTGGHTRVPALNLTYPGITSGASNILISDNNIYGCSTGITVTGSSTIQRNLIINCTNGITAGSQTLIQNNSIINNTIGINCLQTTPTIAYNNIQNSKNNIYLNRASDVNATYNWWGTTNPESINQTMHDFKDDFTLGRVIFSPFLIAPNPQSTPELYASSICPTPVPSLSTSPTTSASPEQTPIPSVPELPIWMLTILLIMTPLALLIMGKKKTKLPR